MQFGASLSEGGKGGGALLAYYPHDLERTQEGSEGNEKLKVFHFPNNINGRTSANHFLRQITTDLIWSPLITLWHLIFEGGGQRWKGGACWANTKQICTVITQIAVFWWRMWNVTHLSSDVFIGRWTHEGETDQENILNGPKHHILKITAMAMKDLLIQG